VPTAPYHEDRIADRVVGFALGLGLEVSDDADGNVFVWHRGARASGTSRRPLIVSAHMDHPAIEVISTEPLVGHLLGSIRADSFSTPVPVRFFNPDNPDDPRGVREVAGCVLGAFELDGVADARVGLHLAASGALAAGAFGVFDTGPVALDEETGLLYLTAADDLAGCAITLAWLARSAAAGVDLDICGAFTRAEEVGLVGVAALVRRRGLPEDAMVISIEASRALPGAELGLGPVIRVGDAATTFHPEGDAVLRAARDRIRGRDADFRVQRQLMSGGICEATAYVVAGYTTGAVCVPLGNYHNQTPDGGIGAEYVHVDDVDMCTTLLVEAGVVMSEGFSWPNDDRSSRRIADRPDVQLRRLRDSGVRMSGHDA
jgi:putative aminopeptidase FrvX